jgi:flagellar basal body-associated protein FliL
LFTQQIVKKTAHPKKIETEGSTNQSRKSMSWLEVGAKWTSVAAVCFTALAAAAGVIAWYLSSQLAEAKDAALRKFQEQSRVDVAAANQKAAEAAEKTSEAELKIETLRNENLTLEAASSDRVFQDQGGAAERLRKYAGTKVFITYADNDQEAKSTAEQIAYVLLRSEWQLLPRSAIPKAGRVLGEGVNVLGKDNNVPALIEELKKTAIIRPIAGDPYPHPFVASAGLVDEVLVQVGTKPDAFAAKRYHNAFDRAKRDPNFRIIIGSRVNIPE